MFTGLVQATGRVISVSPTSSGVRLLLSPENWSYTPNLGDSIAVSGCCLTVAAERPDAIWEFDAVPETLSKTTLGSFKSGTRVNLEHSATPTTLLGGHIVQGHIDGVGVVDSITNGREHRVRIRPPSSLMPFMAPTGSVALDGVSLTIARVSPDDHFIEVVLIPTTLARTTLGDWVQGTSVNIEADALVKAVIHYTKHYRTT